MSRAFFYFLIAVAVVLGTPYAAMLLNRAMGPWSATGIERDGSTTYMEFGDTVPRPDWVPIPPDASIVQSSFVRNSKDTTGVGILELASQASLDDLKRFYIDRLKTAGFTVQDLGTGTLNAAAASYLGVASMLVATREATGDQININIRMPEGILATRLIQMNWRNLAASHSRLEAGPH